LQAQGKIQTIELLDSEEENENVEEIEELQGSDDEEGQEMEQESENDGAEVQPTGDAAHTYEGFPFIF
jgi:hypothetical protein